LRKIAISVTGDPGLTVRLGNSEGKSYESREIAVDEGLIPFDMMTDPHQRERILDGMVIHESGHVVKTWPIIEELETWTRRKPNPVLSSCLVNIVEDIRVNHYLSGRYSLDFASRLKDFLGAAGRTLQMILARHLILGKERFAGSFMIDLLACKAVLGVDTSELEKTYLIPEAREALARACSIAMSARYVQAVPKLIVTLDAAYDALSDSCGVIEETLIPTIFGGRYRVGDWREKLRVWGYDTRTDTVGKGSGLEIPTPQPDVGEYELLAQRNMFHILRLLSILKREVVPTITIEKWHRRGALMRGILSKAVAESEVRDVDRIYKSREVQFRRHRVAILLLVDVSGSMNERDAKDFLTTVGEVLGRWLRDEDFAILAFGSDYLRIKTFVEPFHTTRFRIGGLTCLGGTVLLNPLEEGHRMFKSRTGAERKVCVIISDFCVDEPRLCQDKIAEMKRDGISTIGIGICRVSEETVRGFSDYTIICRRIHELADKFIEVFRRIVFEDWGSTSPGRH